METGGGEEGWGGGAEALLDMSPGSSVSMRYHPLFGSHDDLLLLEVDEKLLPDFLHQGVTIRGHPDEETVLCTPSTTYAIKFVGNSNSVFLIPPGDPSPPNSNSSHCNGEMNSHSVVPEAVASIVKVAPGNMELIQVAPRLDKLKSLLNERLYRLEDDDDHEGTENNTWGKRGLHRWQDLADLIQASDEELRAGLRSLSALEINGYWRIVDENSMDDILKMILSNSIIYEWQLSAMREDEVVPVLECDGFPRKIVLHCLETYGHKEEDSQGCMWSIDEKRLCLHFAKQALRGGKMKLESFMEKWRASLPRGMHADLEMLEGEVLYESIGIEMWIHAFSVSALPSAPAERFAALFRERPKWAWKDLQPYIRDLRVPGLSSEGLLIKYTRRTQPTADVEPIFSAR